MYDLLLRVNRLAVGSVLLCLYNGIQKMSHLPHPWSALPQRYYALGTTCAVKTIHSDQYTPEHYAPGTLCPLDAVPPNAVPPDHCAPPYIHNAPGMRCLLHSGLCAKTGSVCPPTPTVCHWGDTPKSRLFSFHSNTDMRYNPLKMDVYGQQLALSFFLFLLFRLR